MRATITYPSGNGVTLYEDSNPANSPPLWQDVTTDCTIEPARRYVSRVRITNPGEGYTVAPMLAITGGGGTPSDDAYIVIESPVKTVTVTNGGSGYKTAPTVTFSGGNKIQAAAAQAAIAGKVTSVTLTKQGLGYASPPEVVVLGGEKAQITPVMDGYVAFVTVTDGGEGYTSSPSVTLSGGGGTNASATAAFSIKSGQVTGVSVSTAGSGYTSPPIVAIAGGGGEGAKAVATLAYKVSALTLVNGGDKYPENPVVQFVGPAEQLAAATAAIEGEVVSVNVLNQGIYQHIRNRAGTVIADWPTISISGSATATPQFSGKVTQISPGDPGIVPDSGPLAANNKNYTSAPSVTITAASGDVGTGAAAVAEMNWLQTHDRTAEVVNCAASDSNQLCYFAESNLFPSKSQSECSTSGERFEWAVRAGLSFDTAASNAGARTVNVVQFAQGSSKVDPPATLQLLYWRDEGVIVNVDRKWNGGVFDPTYDGSCFPLAPLDATEWVRDWFVARKFSRVPPDVTYRVSFPAQPDEATNATVTPTWTQYVDMKGDSFWYLESLAVDSGGQNLYYPHESQLRLEADGNTVHEFTVFDFAVSRQTPQAQVGNVPGFSEQPTIAISLTETGSPAGTFYQISGATITAGGETDAEDGAVTVPIVLTAGHWSGAPVTLAGTISGGELSAVTLPSPGPHILAPATLTAVSPQDDEHFNNPARITTGRSPYQVSYDHTEPALSIKVVPFSGGTDALFDVALSEKADLNGDPFWEIESAIATAVGSQHDDNSTIVIDVDSPGIQAVRPVLNFVYDRQQPSPLILKSTLHLSGQSFSTLDVQFTEEAGEFGDPYWTITGITVTEPTLAPSSSIGGPNGGPGGGLVFLPAIGETESLRVPCPAAATYTVDESGYIDAIQITDGGVYYLETRGIRRLHPLNGGRFFVRDFNVSSEPLPAVSCIGPVSTAAGWSQNTVLFRFDGSLPFEVGAQYDGWTEPAGNGFASRVRRCPLPEIDVELE